MALKPDRDFDCSYNMGYFWAANGQAPAEEGGIAGVVSAGSGVALDDPGSSGIAPGKGGVNTVDYVADPSGVQAVGLLLHAIEAEPVTSFKRKNYHTNAQWPGDPVSLLRRGWVVTDRIVGSPVAGSGAFLGASGQLSTSQAASAPQVGRFETTKDADGFARVFLDI